MASVDDVVAFIFEQNGEIGVRTLHLLLYYCQAWNMVWDDVPLFAEPIHAYSSYALIPSVREKIGPFVRLTQWHHGDSKALTDDEVETVVEILESYAFSAWELFCVWRDDPLWKEAREGLDHTSLVGPEIEQSKIKAHYLKIDQDENSVFVTDTAFIDEPA